MRKIERDAVFFRHSKGGVTFSGGEPTMQEEFLRGLTEKFYSRGISMWIEKNLRAFSFVFKNVLRY
ncbi:MAG: hypothetical protein FWH52_07905 [Synergistaceae bacterium]|nr:hypothetical protein [Synergistaceae bacterium]